LPKVNIQEEQKITSTDEESKTAGPTETKTAIQTEVQHPEPVPEAVQKTQESVQKSVQEPVIETTSQEIPQVKPEEAAEETPSIQEPSSSERSSKIFDELIAKIYDRSFELGECFKRNIEFESFENGELTWGSTAEGDDKKQLVTHWGVINMFVKELFGYETKIINIAKKKTDIPEPVAEEFPEETPPHQDADSASMLEDIEMKSSCIAPDAGDTEAAKEKDPSALLEEPMIKEAIALFDPKKVRIKRNS